MRSTNSIFNKGYFRFLLKRTWPTALVFGVLYLLAFAIFSVVVAVGSGSLVMLRMEHFFVPSLIVMALFLIVMTARIFDVFYKKDSTDFIGAAPVYRTAISLTGAILGLFYIAAFTLVTTGLLALLLRGSAVTVFGELIRYFFLFFSGSAVVYALCSLAAQMSGTKVGSALLAFVFVFVVPLLIGLAQLITIFSKESSSPYGAVSPLPAIFMPLSFHSSLVTGYPHDFVGVLVSVLYNLALAVGYFLLGAYVMKHRKLEITESHFGSELRTDIVMGLTVLPVFLISIFLSFVETGIGSVVGILTIPLLSHAVGFLIYSVIVRKGFRKFGHAAVTYVATFGAALVILVLCNLIGILPSSNRSYEKRDFLEAQSVTVTVPYRDTVNISDNETAGTRITLTDPELISFAFDSVEQRDYRFGSFDGLTSLTVPDKTSVLEVRFKNGRTERFSFSFGSFDQFVTEKNKKSVYELYGDKIAVSADGQYVATEFFVDMTEYSATRIRITDPRILDVVKSLRAKPDRTFVPRDVDYYWYDTGLFGDCVSGDFGLSQDCKFGLVVYTYRNGSYYAERFELRPGTEEYDTVMQINIDILQKIVLRSEAFGIAPYLTLPDSYQTNETVRLVTNNLMNGYRSDIFKAICESYGQTKPEECTDIIGVTLDGVGSCVVTADLDAVLAPFRIRFADDLETVFESLCDDPDYLCVTASDIYVLALFENFGRPITVPESVKKYMALHLDEMKEAYRTGEVFSLLPENAVVITIEKDADQYDFLFGRDDSFYTFLTELEAEGYSFSSSLLIESVSVKTPQTEAFLPAEGLMRYGKDWMLSSLLGNCQDDRFVWDGITADVSFVLYGGKTESYSSVTVERDVLSQILSINLFSDDFRLESALVECDGKTYTADTASAASSDLFAKMLDYIVQKTAYGGEESGDEVLATVRFVFENGSKYEYNGGIPLDFMEMLGQVN